MRDTSITFEEVEHVTEADSSAYDIVFVDDASYNDKVAAFSGWVAEVGRLVFLSGRDSGEEIGGRFDFVIKKPFLPSQIQAVIDQVKEEMPEKEEREEEDILPFVPDAVEEAEAEEVKEEITDTEEETTSESFIFPLSGLEESDGDNEGEDVSEEEEESAPDEEVLPQPKVLDSNEIEQIKALLDEEEEEIDLVEPADEEEYEARKVEVITQKLEADGLEIVEEEEIISSLSEEPKKKKEKAKRKKKKKKKEEDIYTMEEALLAAIENMKPKKIKKLLKGAEVTINIRFKDEV
jgi:hypothetical protein